MLLKSRIPLSYIISKVKYDLVYVLAVSLILLVITSQFEKLTPDIPLTIPVFIGTAISILLSFKLNQSYDRWWEARKVWGSIVNDSRSLVIQLQSFVAAGNDVLVSRMARRQVAWCYSLGRSLRGLNPVENLEQYLIPEDLEQLQKHNNKPLALLSMHAQDIASLRRHGYLDSFSHVHLDSTLARLCDAQGKAERIKWTVFPVTYLAFLHGIIYLFIITMSVALNDIGGFVEIPLLLLISSAFLLLEKSATHMQDPFENRPTDTPVTAIAHTIEINIKQLLKTNDVPKPLEPDNFFLL